jgi:prolycopene isomerase
MIYPKSEVPSKALKALNMRSEGTSFLSMYMGLNRSAEELGLKHYMYYFAKNGDISAAYDGIGELTPNNCFAGMCPNPLIPNASPEGTSILHLETIYKAQPWAGLSEKEYFKKKHELAGDLIDRASTALGFPIRKYIEEIEVAAPQTFSRYIGSHMGNVYGYDHRVFDSVVIKAMMQKSERFIKGLSMVGNAGLLVAGMPSSILSGRLATIEQIAAGRS